MEVIAIKAILAVLFRHGGSRLLGSLKREAEHMERLRIPVHRSRSSEKPAIVQATSATIHS